MIELEGTTAFKAWLEDQPREIALILSARSTLRAMPLLAQTFQAGAIQEHNNLVLPIWRSLISAVACAVEKDDAVAASAASTAYAATNVYADDISYGISGKASSSVAFAADTSAYVSYAPQYVEAALRAISEVAEFTDPWRDISSDTDFLINHAQKSELINQPLWSAQQQPDWNKDWWRHFEDHLNQYLDEKWHVWTDWWEDRRDGKPYNIEMEREIVLIPDEDWGKGPAHVNAMIAEIRARYAVDETPADNPVAPRFETVGGRIALRTDTPDEPPTDDQAALYDALHSLTVELNALCPENSNRYGLQGKAVGRFLRALGEDYGSMQPGALWLAGQSLRRFERADTAKRAADDPEDEPMEPDQSALFEEVVTAYNVFSTGEPKLKALDEMGREYTDTNQKIHPENESLNSEKWQKNMSREEVFDILGTDPLRIALGEFDFDDFTELMRMVPFPQDLTNLNDNNLETERKEALSSLKDFLENLADDLEKIESNSENPKQIARELRRYGKEARRRPVRARFLWLQGATLNLYRLSPNSYPFLPEIERQKLDMVVDLHLDLMRLYYRGALARAQDAETLLLTEEVSLRDLNSMIAEAANLLAEVADDEGAHAEPETISALRNLVETTDALIDRLEEMGIEERARSEKELMARTKAGAMTVLRLGLRMKAEAADFAELSNVDFQNLLDRLLRLIPQGGGS